MRFLADNQLPPAPARFIDSELGAEGTHVTVVGLRDASDADVSSTLQPTVSSLCLRTRTSLTMALKTLMPA